MSYDVSEFNNLQIKYTNINDISNDVSVDNDNNDINVMIMKVV